MRSPVKYPLIGAFGFSLSISTASAQPVLSPQVTVPPAPVLSASTESLAEPEIALEELISLALQNNPQLPIARENRVAARENSAALRAFYNPRLQLIPALGGNRESRDEEILLSQPLDVFGQRRAARGVAQAQLRRADAELTLIQRSLRVQVKSAAANLFAAQEAENLSQTQVEIARLFRAAAARRAELGDVPPVQVQRADLELLRATNEFDINRAERLARRAALNGVIGQAPQTPLRVAQPVENIFPILTPDEANTARQQLVAGIMNRPDAVGAQATLDAQRAQVAAIGRERLPQIEIQARRSTFLGRNDSTALRAVVNLPLFDFGSINGQKKAAQAEMRAQEARINWLRQQASTQVEQASVRLAQHRQTVVTFRTGIVPQTLDLLRKTQIGYAAGASTYLEVLEAQRTLKQVQTEYLQALVSLNAGETALENALEVGFPGSLQDAITASIGISPSFTPPAGGRQ